MKSTTCPKCGKRLDASMDLNSPDETEPQEKPGDISICFYCTEILQFDDALNLVPASQEVIAQIPEKEKRTLEHIIDTIKQKKWLQ